MTVKTRSLSVKDHDTQIQRYPLLLKIQIFLVSVLPKSVKKGYPVNSKENQAIPVVHELAVIGEEQLLPSAFYSLVREHLETFKLVWTARA